MSHAVIERLKSGLIVSCQPVEGGPMDRTDIVVAMAKAAIAGGACGLRIEGVERVRAVAAVCSAPVIGIVKRHLSDSAVRITPLVTDVRDLAEAGAQIIAFDGTKRRRPVPANDLLAAVHAAGCLPMADCATYEEGAALAYRGCAFLGSTLSGYTGGAVPRGPDLDLVRRWSDSDYRAIAEGRYDTPEMAGRAIERGAFAVTVGSAITRIEHITGWYRSAMDHVAAGAGEGQ